MPCSLVRHLGGQGLELCSLRRREHAVHTNEHQDAGNVPLLVDGGETVDGRALGRGIAGGAPTVTLNLAPVGLVYPNRLNTVDMRFTKIVRVGRTRTSVGVDLYNLLNANTGTSFNQNFGTDGSTWLRPNAILNPRYVRFNATVDF
jgi:hypothetical protein